MNNLILTGFMGVGKTTVGQAVAQQLNCPFYDLDQYIELRIGKPIAAIFEQEGEEAFRKIEEQICQTLAQKQQAVIATGGGTLLSSKNQKAFAEDTIICLTASPAYIFERFDSQAIANRPLLRDGDAFENFRRLYDDRKSLYAQFTWQVDVSDKPLEQICQEVQSCYQNHVLYVQSPSNRYPLIIGNQNLFHFPHWLKKLGFPHSTKIGVITDQNLKELHYPQIQQVLQQAGYQPSLFTIGQGEHHKTIDTVLTLLDGFLANQLDRHSLILALGGGIVCDVAGFAAATFMRGLPHVQIPTSLLAMVDASIGGKTGVNLTQGKNLMGAFKQPEAVWIDTQFLSSLPHVERINGLAEAIKHGIIANPALFSFFEQTAGDWSLLQSHLDWLVTSIEVKKQIVEQDPYEKNIRASLNLGHTAGHAIEKESGFAIKHGNAVAIGIIIAANIAVNRGILQASARDRIQKVLTAWQLPTHTSLDAEAIYEKCLMDKKKKGKQLQWVLPEKIGAVTIKADISKQEVLNAIEQTKP